MDLSSESDTEPNREDIWTDKHKPTKIGELACNVPGVNSIKAWLNKWPSMKKEAYISNREVKKKGGKKNSKDRNKSCLMVKGTHGIGKSVSVETVLKSSGYRIKKINFNSIKIGKDIKSLMQQIINSNNVLDMINGDASKTAIVVDELESVSSTTDKNFITTMLKTNDLYWYLPIVFISNNQHSKFLSDIRDNSLEIKFWPPYKSDMNQILNKICAKEGINIRNKLVSDKIVEYSQSDIRRLINTLEDIKFTYDGEPINMNIIHEYFNMSKKKDIDKDLFKATGKLLDDYNSIDECITYYETEKTALPLMIQWNYVKRVIDYCDEVEGDNKSCDTLLEVADMLSTGDVVENYIYGDQSWDMQEIHGFYTCAATSFELDRYKKSSEQNIFDNEPGSNISYTLDFNKTSIMKINRKNVINANRCFQNSMDISDYIYMNKIIRRFVKNNKIKECVEMMRDYGIELEHIESLLKIDKINNNKGGSKRSLTILSMKQKREFEKYLKEL